MIHFSTDYVFGSERRTPYAEDDIPALVARIGASNVLFGSDCPMDATAGVAFTTDAIRSVNGLQVTEAERALIFRGNAGRVLKTG